MKRLPFGVRLAAGVAVTMYERARTLPRALIGLPVTAASEVLQCAMRVQQGLTELAIKGDGALSAFQPVEQAPEWATFDEDLTEPRGSTPARFGDSFGSEPIEAAGTEEREIAKLREDLNKFDERDPSTMSAWDAVARELSATKTEPRTSTRPADALTSPAETEPDTDARSDETEAPTREEPPAPRAFPNYAELSLPQLRARLRRFSVPELNELLDYERATRERPEFVRMLRNRIETVRADEQSDQPRDDAATGGNAATSDDAPGDPRDQR